MLPKPAQVLAAVMARSCTEPLHRGCCCMINEKSQGGGWLGGKSEEDKVLILCCTENKSQDLPAACKHRAWGSLPVYFPFFFFFFYTCVVFMAQLIWESAELVACGHYNFHLGSFFLDFRKTIPDSHGPLSYGSRGTALSLRCRYSWMQYAIWSHSCEQLTLLTNTGSSSNFFHPGLSWLKLDKDQHRQQFSVSLWFQPQIHPAAASAVADGQKLFTAGTVRMITKAFTPALWKKRGSRSMTSCVTMTV